MKTLTSSPTVITLLADQLWRRNKVWYRNRIKIKQLPTVLGRPTARPPQTTWLPQELVDMIISYFIYDTNILLACSATCFSWYIAAVPHLHHSLTTDDHAYRWPNTSKKYLWPGPLKNSYELGLLPFVKRFRFRLDHYPGNKFTLDDRTLRYFSALTNLCELGIDHLRLLGSIQDIQRCFGHFAPTLRFLALKEPEGSCRQILYFVGLFPNLQDLKLFYGYYKEEQESTADAKLVPPSVPPLHGRLTLTYFARGRLVEDMITLFSGLRFRHMDLFEVKCTQLLLGACADTLETLRLYPTDSYGEEVLPVRGKKTSSSSRSIANDEGVRWHFDLSQNKALRTLETTAEAMIYGDGNPRFLKTVLSTITSPFPLDVVVVYQHYDVGYHLCWWWTTPGQILDETVWSTFNHRRRFEEFREMYMVRGFHLVLCADILNGFTECTLQGLEHVVEMEKVKGGFDYLLSEPLIISEVRSRTRLHDFRVGEWERGSILASAL